MIYEKLSVVVPAYNEGQWIFKNLLTVNESLSRWHSNYSIIVVNDGSADNTLAECERAAAACPHILVASYEENAGKGHALKKGVLAADDEGCIATLDADLDLPPDQLERMYRRMLDADADVVVGSKMHRDSNLEYPFSRRVASYGYYLLVRILFGLKVHDTQTGIKIFKACCLKPIMAKTLVKKYACDIEILALCGREKCKIIEAPIELVFNRPNGFGRIGFWDIFYTGWDTAAVFYRLKLLKYYD